MGGRMTEGVASNERGGGPYSYTDVSVPAGPWDVIELPDSDLADEGEVSFGIACSTEFDLDLVITTTGAAPPEFSEWYGGIWVYIDDVLAPGLPLGIYGFDGDSQTFNLTDLEVTSCSKVTVYTDIVNSSPEQNVLVTAEVVAIR